MVKSWDTFFVGFGTCVTLVQAVSEGWIFLVEIMR